MRPNRLRHSLVHVGHWTWSRKIAGFQFSYPKPCGGDEIVNFTIKLATAPNMLPEWRDPVLPDSDARIGSPAMLQKDEAPTRFSLPRHWGSDKTAIADGTHVKLRENNLMGSTHIRYGGYGGIAYCC